jgi:hypothetical protein
MGEARAGRPNAALVMFLLVCGLVIGWFASSRHSAAHKPKPPELTEHVANTPALLTAVRDLARLESVSFHIEKVIDLQDTQARMGGMLHAHDSILLVAAGDVVAGIDLSKLRDGDVTVIPTSSEVRLQLPPPEILSVQLDSRHTYVHSRKTDLLARPSVDIETRARMHAEEDIRNGALDAGILERARQNTGHTLSALVRSLGYEHVVISWGECVAPCLPPRVEVK